MQLPPALAKIVAFFEGLSEEEKREILIAYAERAERQEPRRGEGFDFEDVRKDVACADTVGIFLRIDAQGRANFRITLGPQVQTLTRAMATILCRGLNGSRPEVIASLPPDFVEKIVGRQLLRIRSRTVYYVFQRMQNACSFLLQNRGAKM